MIKRALRVVVTLFVVVAAGVFVVLQIFGGAVIKKTVNVAGPQILGVPVVLDEANLSIISGHAHLKGLRVGNPEGFKTDHLFEVGRLDVELDVRSLLSDTIRIRSIRVLDPSITYERGLLNSNLGALLDQLGGEADAEAKPGETPPEQAAAPDKAAEKAGGAKVIIDEFRIEGARVRLSLTAAQGLAAPIPLPPIVLTDMGKESEGASFTDVLRDVFKAVFGSVTSVLVGAGKLVGEGAELVGEGVMAVGEGAVKGVGAVGGAAVDGATVVGGAAVDGAQAVGGAVVGGAKAAGGAVVDGASKVVGGIGSLFGAGGDEEEKKSEPAESPQNP